MASCLLLFVDFNSARVFSPPKKIERLIKDAKEVHIKNRTYYTAAQDREVQTLESSMPKRAFYIHNICLPAPHSSFCDFIFAYQTIKERSPRWLMRNVEGLQGIVNDHCRAENMKSGALAATTAALAFPISLFFAKRHIAESLINTPTIPSFSSLQEFLNKNSLFK